MNSESDDSLENHSEDKSHSSGSVENGEESSSACSTSVPQPLTSLNPVENTFFVEVMKNGLLLSKKFISKSVITFGRSRDCDFPMDHPSISRYHCALLWKEDPVNSNNFGFFYLMDLNSTHGTFLNKQKLDSKKLVKVASGNNIFKLGGSSRVFMLNSCLNDVDADEDRDVTEKGSKSEEVSYCSWGILDEATEEQEDNEASAPLASILALLQTDYSNVSTVNDNVYRENPQKTVQQWFEREGYEYQYKMNCINGKFKCTFELPIDGQDVVVEGKLFLKKKESIHDACLRCCQLLDKANILFPWQMQKAQQKARYGSDSDDDMIDETGEIEKKRSRKDASTTINTFETLTEKWNNLSSELKSLKAKLATMNVANCSTQRKANDESDDALDSFMDSLRSDKGSASSTIDSKIQKSKLRVKISELEKSQKRIERLLKLSKPNKSLEELKLVSKSSARNVPQVNATSKEAIKAKIDSIINKKSMETPLVDTKNEKIQEKQEKKEKKVNFEKTCKVFLEDEDDGFKKPQHVPLMNERDKPPTPELKRHKKSKTVPQKYTQKEDYIEWVPPATQTGDGRTSLNEKYGY